MKYEQQSRNKRFSIVLIILVVFFFLSPIVTYQLHKAFTPPPVGFTDVRDVVEGERGGRFLLFQGPVEPGREPDTRYYLLVNGTAKRFIDQVPHAAEAEVTLSAEHFQRVRDFRDQWCWDSPANAIPQAGEQYYIVAMHCLVIAKHVIVPAESLPAVLREVQQLFP